MEGFLPQLPPWPCRFAALGTLALAGVLLAGACRSEALPEPESQGGATREPVAASPSVDPASEEPEWGDATARARAATFRVYVHEEGLYEDHYDDAGQVEVDPAPVDPEETWAAAAATVTVRDNDAPPAPRYDTYDVSGRAATPGSYTFLAAAAAAAGSGSGDDNAGRVSGAGSLTIITTYEGLREDANQLLIHLTDARGVSRAAFFGAVVVGDVLEWRRSTDCWVRYLVTALLPDPPDAPARKHFAIRGITDAWTGCSGPLAPTLSASSAENAGAQAARTTRAVDIERNPAALQSPDITVPVRHGPWYLKPAGWSAPLPGPVFDPAYTHLTESSDLAVVQRHPLWRAPTVPRGWRLFSATVGPEGMNGIRARYVDAEGYIALDLVIHQLRSTGFTTSLNFATGSGAIGETRIIDGHPAFVTYSPSDDPNHNRFATTTVEIYDESRGILYLVYGMDPSLNGSNIEATIAIARSLYTPAGSP